MQAGNIAASSEARAGEEGDVAARLLRHLQAALGAPELRYADTPSRLFGGFDAAVFAFQLAHAPFDFAGPLILRIERPSQDLVAVRRDVAVQNALAAQGFLAPRVLLVAAAEVLGGAATVMERLSGAPIGEHFQSLGQGGIADRLRLLVAVPRERRRLIALWGEAQRRLHAVSVEAMTAALSRAGISAADMSFESQLQRMEGLARDVGLNGLAPGIRWLGEHHPVERGPRVICHGDLQPLNILAQHERLTGVIDWGACTVADPALDLGVSLALMHTVPVGEGPLSPLTRALMRGIGRAHLRAYARVRPLDPGAVRYYQAYGCLSQLLWVALARACGRPGRGIFDSPEGVRNLSRHFATLTGVATSLAAA